jgi:Xaa-Pro aminopeptidase
LKTLLSANTFGEVDEACRQVITKRAYGNRFIHATGHGIGLEVHELPWIRQNEKEQVKPGIAATIEPGIYLNGKFGVRIEDSVTVKEGTEKHKNTQNKNLISNLNSFPKDLICLN